MRHAAVMLALAPALICTPALADTPEDLLIAAGYTSADKPTALARINQAIALCDASLKRNPGNGDARLQRALAVSYRGKLNRSRGDLLAARKVFETLIAANPRDAEAQLALAGWHLGAVLAMGPMMARAALGARSATGSAALDRAVAFSGGRAAMPAFASLERIQLDPGDVAGARRLAEASLTATANTRFDKVMQRQAGALLAVLRTGNGKAAAAKAKQLMPFSAWD